jgi:sugar-specific transcriptional regulator TrmB
MDTKTLLENLGLDERESEIYLALLELGPQLPQYIARNTGIKRTTLYEIFPEMIKRGLIVEITQGKRRLFQATSPDKLFGDYERKYKEIKANITDLTAIYRLQGLRPKIEVYEGFDGMKKFYNYTLESKEVCKCFVQPAKYNPRVLDWLVKEYVPARVKRGVLVKAIMPDDNLSEYYMGFRKEHLRIGRKVPLSKFHFKIEGMIQGNKIYFANYEKGGPQIGIIIESKQIAYTLGALWDLAWEGAAAYGGKVEKGKAESRK